MSSRVADGLIACAARAFGRSLLFMFVIGYGCTEFQREAQVQQYLDENTGATITHLAEPLIFATGKVLAAYTRDYVTVGPLEINRQGQRSYLLWMNFWTTVDRFDTWHGEAGQFDIVYLMLDGEPIQLNAADDSSPGMGMVGTPYSKQGGDSFASVYSVTRAQLTRLAQAREVELRTNVDALDFGRYQLWRAPERSIEHFARYVSNDSIARMSHESPDPRVTDPRE